MHPSDRPANVAQFQAELMGRSTVGRTVERLLDQDQPIAQFVRVHRGLLALIGVLLLAAILVTVRPARISPTPTPAPVPTWISPAAEPTGADRSPTRLTPTLGPGTTQRPTVQSP